LVVVNCELVVGGGEFVVVEWWNLVNLVELVTWVVN
jgi:hypothetical protein